MKSNNLSTETDFFCSHRLCDIGFAFFSRSSHQINERSRSGEGFFDDDGSLKVKTQEKKKIGGISIKLNLKFGKGRFF